MQNEIIMLSYSRIEVDRGIICMFIIIHIYAYNIYTCNVILTTKHG